jgi:uncharacterized membrane protein YphA (DoxX/SURF4 family)
MMNMDDSMSQAAADSPSEPQLFDLPAWKSLAGWICSGLLAVIFLVAGVWKLSDPLATAARMTQALIPPSLALATALGAGIAETFAGLLVLVPRWRRWGALLCGLMLLAFMAYIGFNYHRLAGEDCSCFPWLKRSVGPGFFISDFLMLLLAAGAWLWARPSESVRNALVALGAIGVFAGAVYGVTLARQSGIEAPASISVNGAPVSLKEGRVLIFFLDPECSHCDQSARALSRHTWKNVRLFAVPTTQPQWGAAFIRDTKIPAALSLDAAPLRAVFSFTDPPYGVALVNGHQVQAFTFADDKAVAEELRKLGFIE